MMQPFIRVYTVKVKKIFRQNKYNIFFNYNLTTLDMYNGLSQVYCIKPEEEPISKQRVKERLYSYAVSSIITGVIYSLVLKLINHKWFTYLVMLCNVVHYYVSYIFQNLDISR